jgi:hypothetical protein
MTIESHGHEHEFEPQHGLPERLPADERILWQGSPCAPQLARSAFHIRKLSLYFSIIVIAHAVSAIADDSGFMAVLAAMLWPMVLSVGALGSVWLLAWLTARTAVYTITDRRVVMRIGIVLTLTFNLPLRTIESAALRPGAAGSGDIVLSLRGPDRIAWLHLWPHARPWKLSRPEPMLRSVADAQAVSAVLAQAWSQATGVALDSRTTEDTRPEPVAKPTPVDGKPQQGASDLQPSLS